MKKSEKDIPVVVAGGIYDKSDADCIFELGAQEFRWQLHLSPQKNVMPMKITRWHM